MLKIESNLLIANNCNLFHVSFYTAAPLSLCCTSAPDVFKFVINWIEEFTFRGENQMTINKFNEWEIIVPLVRQRWYTWIGAGLFSWGWIHQRRCHAILVSFSCRRSSWLMFCMHFSIPLRYGKTNKVTWIVYKYWNNLSSCLSCGRIRLLFALDFTVYFGNS